MANKVRLDALTAQAIDASGEQVQERTAKEQARDLVLKARVSLVGGLPSTSPYARFTHDQAMSEAARLDMRLAPFMSPEDLLLVIENIRLKIVQGDAPPPDPDQPPVPVPAARPIRIRGLKESPTNRWVVICPSDKPKQVSVGGGQMTVLRQGKIINGAYYTRDTLQSIVDQGVKLRPIEDPIPDED
jgi:hypothetical protein